MITLEFPYFCRDYKVTELLTHGSCEVSELQEVVACDSKNSMSCGVSQLAIHGGVTSWHAMYIYSCNQMCDTVVV